MDIFWEMKNGKVREVGSKDPQILLSFKDLGPSPIPQHEIERTRPPRDSFLYIPLIHLGKAFFCTQWWLTIAKKLSVKLMQSFVFARTNQSKKKL
jgi:hypothetical protein